VNLPVGVEHPVEAALGTDVKAPIRQHRHDLPRRERCEFRLIAGQQDPLAFLLAEAVSHVEVAALATVDAITVTSKLTAPALQRGEPHTEQQGQFMGPGTIGPALIVDLECLPAIVR
jgi:hypothetical protein